MEHKQDCLSTKWTRSLQGIPPFTHEHLKQHLIGETAQESKQEGKQPRAHKQKNMIINCLKIRWCLRLKLLRYQNCGTF